MSITTLGIDTSLRSTGICVFSTGTSTFQPSRITSTLTKNSPITEHVRRVNTIVESVREVVREHSPSIAAIESHFFTPAVDSSFHRRAGLWWAITGMLVEEEVDVILVAPTELKRWITGRGTATKDTVVRAVNQFWPELNLTNDDEADACVLAAIAACHSLRESKPTPDIMRETLRTPYTRFKATFIPHTL